LINDLPEEGRQKQEEKQINLVEQAQTSGFGLQANEIKNLDILIFLI